jgi:hypothetical protein
LLTSTLVDHIETPIKHSVSAPITYYVGLLFTLTS